MPVQYWWVVVVVMVVVVGQISQIYEAASMKLCLVIYNIAGPYDGEQSPEAPWSVTL